MTNEIDQPSAGSLPIHLGSILKDELAELEVSAAELARQTGVPANRISQLINGKRSVTGDTALRLGLWFGVSPQFRLNLQTAYDLAMARQSAGDDIAKLPRRTAA
ncbi:MAG: HigA family addiction module antidote protein [Bauldia sp.]|nr:HigA family addiction module antidote protein [Bauldia sp.]